MDYQIILVVLVGLLLTEATRYQRGKDWKHASLAVKFFIPFYPVYLKIVLLFLNWAVDKDRIGIVDAGLILMHYALYLVIFINAVQSVLYFVEGYLDRIAARRN